MSEWSIEHAWKAILATITERYRNTSQRITVNNLLLQNVARCVSVNVSVRRQFLAHLTQFLHDSCDGLTCPIGRHSLDCSLLPSARHQQAVLHVENSCYLARSHFCNLAVRRGVDDS